MIAPKMSSGRQPVANAKQKIDNHHRPAVRNRMEISKKRRISVRSSLFADLHPIPDRWAMVVVDLLFCIRHWLSSGTHLRRDHLPDLLSAYAETWMEVRHRSDSP